MEAMARPPPKIERRLAATQLVHPASGQVLDSGMAVFLTSPRTATGEDMAELHVHGAPAVVAAVLDGLQALASHTPMRMALPGEFTRRALAAGKMDLVQVEGLADLLAASSEAQRATALAAALGNHSATYTAWTEAAAHALAMAEAMVDFGEDEGLDAAALDAALDALRPTAADMASALAGARASMAIRDGARVALGGLPNAGKSSMLNVLAGRDAAIVDATPGTTRDALEVPLDLGGFPVVVADTAGVRASPESSIEAEGIRRAQAAWRDAAIRVLVVDDGGQAVDDALSALAPPLPQLVVLNKADTRAADASAAAAARIASRLPGVGLVEISCADQVGIDALEAELTAAVSAYFDDGDRGTGSSTSEGVVVTRARVRDHLRTAHDSLVRAFDARAEPDLVGEALRDAVAALGSITGVVDAEAVLDIVFAEFCIGK
ncbi:small GTP-binding protein [Thecamonas trahens ATCC 50062]|uniref:Small GTP-binding protein n=1 Tax=Thecamonas trahens ATCC 50062 TaxID=461836 RepID=A0A0L0D7H6_THETB|nr:small GTP-binding protein [Thecamonas trahens ATCC 50062]KNC47253.1 small GTP-binding protein [Thecamonas trahens ATCC 50062]|eukprot:XP_013759596.1 small GTP-binding protein [Thecamonas trahens ATCC 50062]